MRSEAQDASILQAARDRTITIIANILAIIITTITIIHINESRQVLCFQDQPAALSAWLQTKILQKA